MITLTSEFNILRPGTWSLPHRSCKTMQCKVCCISYKIYLFSPSLFSTFSQGYSKQRPFFTTGLSEWRMRISLGYRPQKQNIHCDYNPGTTKYDSRSLLADSGGSSNLVEHLSWNSLPFLLALAASTSLDNLFSSSGHRLLRALRQHKKRGEHRDIGI